MVPSQSAPNTQLQSGVEILQGINHRSTSFVPTKEVVVRLLRLHHVSQLHMGRAVQEVCTAKTRTTNRKLHSAKTLEGQS